MNYIKSFESLRISDIILNLKDIFKDLSDDIYDVYIKEETMREDKYICVGIYKNSTGIENARAEYIYLYEIIDFFKRSIDYLTTEGFKISSVIPYGFDPNFDRNQLDLDIDYWDPNCKMLALNIYFVEAN
jgi:hypothetical protein